MTRLQRFALLLIACLPLACTAPLITTPAGPAANPQAARPPLIAPNPNAAATPTPFQPLAPTATYFPTTDPQAAATATLFAPEQTKTWGDYPAPVIFPSIEIPPPMGLLTHPAGQVNILLLGSDQRPYDGGFRTDTIMLLTINPQQGSVRLTSFPRDLYIYIPGWSMDRINTAMARSGFEGLAQTFEYNFGVRPDRYMVINFTAFQQLIDSLGGIDVYAASSLTDHRDGFGQYTVPAGTIHMDGETALWYVRSRYSSSDFDRTRRQQEVLQALFLRLISLNALQRAPELFEIYRQNVSTNLQIEDITPLLSVAGQMTNPQNVDRHAIGPQHVTRWIVPESGADVLLPIRDAIRLEMEQIISQP
ncbi:MAG: hypothetical protein OHK0052_06150 [Anaerolineales bacterium]